MSGEQTDYILVTHTCCHETRWGLNTSKKKLGELANKRCPECIAATRVQESANASRKESRTARQESAADRRQRRAQRFEAAVMVMAALLPGEINDADNLDYDVNEHEDCSWPEMRKTTVQDTVSLACFAADWLLAELDRTEKEPENQV